ncbi:testis-specific Y-encoded protein 2-like [Cynocephalus volans]|uniref:testis-specific Y-encoded protein 2-like n=1 Tax=Cynocephalus volans TaxID=110931 RepID=UPI002FCC4DEA
MQMENLRLRDDRNDHNVVIQGVGEAEPDREAPGCSQSRNRACGSASLAAAGGVQLKAFVLAYAGRLSLLRTRAALGGTPEEASGTGFEAVEREAAATGQEVALDPLDVMEVVEVVAEEHEEGDEDDRQAPLAWAPVAPVPPLEALEILQLELGAVNARGSRASARLKRKLGKRRRRHLERRTAIIQDIPGFWAKVVSFGLCVEGGCQRGLGVEEVESEQVTGARSTDPHWKISAVISAQDEDVLSYMTDLQVEELDHSTYGCRMLFYFRKNPYFRNAVIMKEYHLSLTGPRASFCSQLQWFSDDEVEAPFPMGDTVSLSFLNWLCDHIRPGPDTIAEIIIEDLWLNPLKYYPR